jgi:hypothetical protein
VRLGQKSFNYTIDRRIGKILCRPHLFREAMPPLHLKRREPILRGGLCQAGARQAQSRSSVSAPEPISTFAMPTGKAFDVSSDN